MKLMIRHANKVVGLLTIVGFGFLIFVIFMLGSSQRWFSRDYYFKTFFSSASGLGNNMAVLYKGFTIGNVKDWMLAEDNRVEVHFTIQDTYINRVKYGSLVEIQASPIGMGSSFIFHPGLGEEEIEEWGTIPAINSREGKRILYEGMAVMEESDDSISNLMNRANTLLDSLNDLIVGIDEAFIGTDATSLGRTMEYAELAMADLYKITEELPTDITDTLDSIVDMLNPVLSDLAVLTNQLTGPDSMIMAALDIEGEIYTSLVASLQGIAGTLNNIKKTTDSLPAFMPQIGVLLIEVNNAIKYAEDVLIALMNNPLLKGGVPKHIESKAGGTHSRDLEF